MKKILLFCLVIALSSCASIMSGRSTMINLSASDSTLTDEVKVQVKSKNGIQIVNLPSTVYVKRSNKPIVVEVKDKCYRQTSYTANSTINLWFLGNFITGGLIGTTTDALTGALWTYNESEIIPVVPNGSCKQ